MTNLFARIADIVPKLEGWCTVQKAQTLAAMVLAHRPKLTVEIGVFGGRSLIPMALAHQELSMGEIIAIDPWMRESSLVEMTGSEMVEYWSGLDHEHVFQLCLAAIHEHRVQNIITIFRCRSDEFHLPKDQQIDMLHIDGNHGEVDSAYDVRHYASQVAVGGMLYMDDIAWAGKAYRLISTFGFKELYRMDTGAVFVRTGASNF